MKPTSALVPYHITAASISSSSRNDAASALQPHTGQGVAKPRREVPLPSQEGTKGVMQYALYVFLATPAAGGERGP